MRRPAIAVTLLLAVMAGCRPGRKPSRQPAPVRPAAAADDLDSARKGFATKLRFRGPAPQRYQNGKPPDGVKEVEYTSGDLNLKGWLSAGAGDGKRRPAVVYMHGGWAYGAGDWEDAEP